MSQEFVVFDATGKECDWYDPYLSHALIDGSWYLVELGHLDYEVEIPDGGRFEVREMGNDE